MKGKPHKYIAKISLLGVWFAIMSAGCLNANPSVTPSAVPASSTIIPTTGATYPKTSTPAETSSPSATVTLPMPSMTPTATAQPLASGNTLATLSVIGQGASDENQMLYLYSQDSGFYVFVDITSPNISITRRNLLGTARNTSWVSFANFSDLIAYADFQGNFWVADLAKRHPILIFSDQSYSMAEVSLIWTPDDQHLILDFQDPGYQDMIFHLQTSQWEAWDYICDQLAISPRTGRLATWCISPMDNRFIVLEWGGEFWYSDLPPEQELFHADDVDDPRFGTFVIYRYAGWSADGERIAYFDPHDATGTLFITDSHAAVQLQIPGKAYWLTDYYKERDYLPGIPLQWSRDGSRILLLGVGSAGELCPEYIIDELERTYSNPGCWQVMDVSTGEMIWQASDLYSSPGVLLFRQHYIAPSISGDATYITLFTYHEGGHFYVLNIDTGETLLDSLWRISGAHWGPAP